MPTYLTPPAYWAGYTDAEGCLRVSTSARVGDLDVLPRRGTSVPLRPIVGFQQTNPLGLFDLHREYGGSLSIRDRHVDVHRRQLMFWARGPTATAFLDVVLPYLRIKLPQAQAIQAAGATTTPAGFRDLQQQLSALKKAPGIDPATFPWNSGLNPRHGKEPREGYDLREPIRKPTLDEIAYLAGFLDGDGHLAVARDRIAVIFKVTDGEPLLLARDVYGGSILPDKRNDRLAHHKPIAVYRLQSQDRVRAFLRDVIPFLKEKREQAEAILRLWAWHVSKQIIEEIRAPQHYQMPPDILDKILPGAGRRYRHSPKPEDVIRTCTVCGTKRKVLGQGLCQLHYHRKMKFGDPTIVGRRFVAGTRQYMREQLDGHLVPIPESEITIKSRGQCRICSAPSFARGFCSKHYDQNRPKRKRAPVQKHEK